MYLPAKLMTTATAKTLYHFVWEIILTNVSPPAGLEAGRPTALSVAEAAAGAGGEPETPMGAGVAAAAAKPPAAPRKAGNFLPGASSTTMGAGRTLCQASESL